MTTKDGRTVGARRRAAKKKTEAMPRMLRERYEVARSVLVENEHDVRASLRNRDALSDVIDALDKILEASDG